MEPVVALVTVLVGIKTALEWVAIAVAGHALVTLVVGAMRGR